MTDMTHLNLVIVAGGLGSRLAPMTNHIPKFLVNIGKQTGYVEMIRYWSQYSDFNTNGSLTVVIHSNYAELVKAYHKLYFKDIPLIIKCVDEANGSAHAIQTSCGHLTGRQVLFSWCDVIPVDRIPFEDLGRSNANIVFTNFNNSNRYELAEVRTGKISKLQPRLSADESGGVFGLYLVREFDPAIRFKNGQDFVEIIGKFGVLREHRIEHIVDFGDTPKLVRARALADEAREFNSLTFLDDYVIKAATNNQGQDIIAKEIAWYEAIGEHNTENLDLPLPKVWTSPTKDSFFMTRVPGVPIWKAWDDFSPQDRHYVLKSLVEGRQRIFNLATQETPPEIVLRDVKIEAFDKLVKRYTEIADVIAAFGDIRVVNGYELRERSPIKTIEMLFQAIANHYKDRPSTYGIIHGDLQLSNAMVDIETRRVTIIDPRGYFGQTQLFGLEDYDISKLLYALTGYDSFNYNKKFGISISSEKIDFAIPEPKAEGTYEVSESQFRTIHMLWLAVCWLGLAQYIKNDPVKSVAAHYHGLAMAEQVLHKLYQDIG